MRDARSFEDRGRLAAIEPRTFRSTHIAGSDRSAAGHEVAFRLKPEGRGTRVGVSQDNDATAEARAHSLGRRRRRQWGLRRSVLTSGLP